MYGYPNLNGPFDKDFAALTTNQKAALAWRGAMRLLPDGLNKDHKYQGMATLRQLLVAQMFMEGWADRPTFEAVANAPVNVDEGWRPVSHDARLSTATRTTCRALLEDAEVSSRTVTRWFDEVESNEAFLILSSDMQQIRHGRLHPWQRPPAALPDTLPSGGAAAPQNRHPLEPFWNDWYQDAIMGRQPDWDWLGRMAGINGRAEHGGSTSQPVDPNSLTPEGSSNFAVSHGPADAAAMRAALRTNRLVIPPTFDALQGLVELELQRLMQKNDVDDVVRRIMRLLVGIHETLSQLRQAVSRPEVIEQKQADEVVGLARLYWTKIQELPRGKVDEVVEGLWQAGKGATRIGLIGLSATLLTSMGLPAMAGVAAGTLVFGGRQTGDILKSAKEWLDISKP